MKKAAPFIFIGILLLGLILPNGIRSAFTNNFWSVFFVKNHNKEALTSQQMETVPKSHPHNKLLQARVRMENGDYQTALELLEPFSPNSDPALLQTQAELLFILERYPESLEIWRKLGQYGSLEHAARVLINDDNLNMANVAWQKAFEIRPDIYKGILISHQLMNAKNLREAGDFSAANDQYQVIIDQFPDEAEAYIGLAQSYWQQGHPDLSISTLDQAMESPSSNYRFYLSAGVLYEQSGNPEKALLAYQKALELDPENQDALQAIERLNNPN